MKDDCYGRFVKTDIYIQAVLAENKILEASVSGKQKKKVKLCVSLEFIFILNTSSANGTVIL